MLSFVTPAGEAFLSVAALTIINLLFWVGVLVLAIWLLVTILKLPGLLERIASNTAATNQSLREAIAEIRKVTNQG
jgi:hypothetical protein